MLHASPLTNSVLSSKRESTTNNENPQPGTTDRNHGSNWPDVEKGVYLNFGGTISQSARKETALCGMPSQRTSIPFLKTREYQATALVRGVRRALNTLTTSRNLKDHVKDHVKDHNSRSGDNREY